MDTRKKPVSKTGTNTTKSKVTNANQNGNKQSRSHNSKIKTAKNSDKNTANKSGTNKGPSKKGNKKQHKIRKVITWTFLILLLTLSIGILAGSLFIYVKYGDDIKLYQQEAHDIVNNSTLETFRQTETSLVYDVNNNVISTLKGEKDVYYIKYEEIPDYAIDAMIAIEDKKFLQHEGVDLLANIRAFLALVRNKGDITQGASTITQQLARNIFLSNDISIERKMKEIFLAIELEKKYDKKLIMEFYLNNIYFANGYYGIQAASKGYFNRECQDLSLSEIAFLCAIPNNPTLYNPYDYKEKTKARRDRILYQMLLEGMIEQDDYDKAIQEEIVLNHKTLKKNNYVETFVFYSAARALMEEQGFVFRNEFDSEADKRQYDERYNELYNSCIKSLYYKGYRIYTSIDLSKQKKLQKAVDKSLSTFTETSKEGIYSLQGAAVSIDNETGRVVAIVGGRSQKLTGYTLNRGYQSFRQPGSSIKPLIVYTPLFERGFYPDDEVIDEPIKDGPTNADGVYAGKIDIRKAVEVSKNTIAWKLFEELTPKVGLSYLLNMNFSKIDKNDYYQAASLGGFTTGVSPLEMTAAYATLANDGVYKEPTCIIKITDAKGKTVVSNTIKEKQIYDANAARIMTNVLTGVITRGTGKGLGLNHMPSAGKTGTTNQKKDGWFVGYTPYYTTGVWVGYDMPQKLSSLSGASYPGSIWYQYMKGIHKNLEARSFPSYVDDRPVKEKDKDVEEPLAIEPTKASIPVDEHDKKDDKTLQKATPIDDMNESTTEDSKVYENDENQDDTKEPNWNENETNWNTNTSESQDIEWSDDENWDDTLQNEVEEDQSNANSKDINTIDEEIKESQPDQENQDGVD